MKKFLIITHAFPPFGGGGVQRMVKFATYLKKEGWEATVICPNEKNDSWLDLQGLEEVSSINIIRVGYRNMKNDPLLYRVIRRFYPADIYLGWAFKVIQKLKKQDLSAYKIIFTSGPPHSINLVGYMLARRFKLKWVADFRDHFTLGPEYAAGKIKGIIDKNFEKKILTNADAVILNTLTNQQEVLKHFEGLNINKIHTIYNGFDYNDLVTGHIKLNWPDNKKKYFYLGGLRGDRIDGIFYKILKKAIELNSQLIHEIKIYVVGDYSRKGNLLNELGLKEMFEFHKPVAFNKVADYLINADGCLTWQRPEKKYKGTIAGKLFDYIGMRKPVFSIGQDNGEIAKILVPNNIGISANPDNINEAAVSFQMFHDKIKKNDFDYSSLGQSFFNKFNRENQAKELSAIFNSIV